MTTILLTGRNGQVGWELAGALAPLGRVIATGRSELDLADPDSIRAAIRQANPAIIVNAAAFTSVDDVEQQPALAMRVNGVAPGVIAEEAKQLGALLVHYSTVYVFDGASDRPYVEDDPPNPINVYGRTKLAGERAIAATGCDHLILRTSWVYGARGTNFVLTILRLAREKKELAVVNDQTGSPTWARELAQATADLLRRPNLVRDAGGVYHLAASGDTARFELAHAIIRIMQEISGTTGGWANLKPVTTAEYPALPARRPLHVVTSKDKVKRVFGIEMPHWEQQLRAFLGSVSREL